MQNRLMRHIVVIFTLIAPLITPATAADRDKIIAFMEVTGFDVSLESLRLSAQNAPALIGVETGDFGISWTRLADKVFEPEALKQDAISILEGALDDDVLAHAAAFYASDLGQRLVIAENESHMADHDEKSAQGQELAAALMERNSPQPDYFIDMAESIDSLDHGIKAYQEVQIRFLMAAAASGLIEQRFSEDGLREAMRNDIPRIQQVVMANMIASNAYTYRDFSDDDMRAYRDALATPEMREVYALMNSIHYTLMADRFEILAAEMVKLHPSQAL